MNSKAIQEICKPEALQERRVLTFDMHEFIQPLNSARLPAGKKCETMILEASFQRKHILYKYKKNVRVKLIRCWLHLSSFMFFGFNSTKALT